MSRARKLGVVYDYEQHKRRAVASLTDVSVVVLCEDVHRRQLKKAVADKESRLLHKTCRI
jgi:hypothetical protein